MEDLKKQGPRTVDPDSSKDVEIVQKCIDSSLPDYRLCRDKVMGFVNGFRSCHPDQQTAEDNYYLMSFDLALQLSLLQIATFDQEVNKREILYTKYISETADFVEMINYLHKQNFNWGIFLENEIKAIEQLLNVIEEDVRKYTKHLESIIRDQIQDLAKKADFADFFDAMKRIFSRFVVLDGDPSEGDRLQETYMQGFVNRIIHGEEQKPHEPVSIDINKADELECNFHYKRKAGLLYIETDRGSGSGFIISPDGHAVTCQHVIDGCKKIEVRTEESERKIYPAKVIYEDEKNDIALLKVEVDHPLPHYQVDIENFNIEDGEDIALYGFPFGRSLNENVMELEPSLSKGYISSRNRVEGIVCYYIDLNAMPGFSGGPVFCINSGKIIGYLCGNYGADRSNISYMRGLEYFSTIIKRG